MSNVRRRLRERNRLVLGWSVDRMLDPMGWVPGRATNPETVPDSHLFTVAADAAGAHTCVVAQSGSGKSFLVGRLVEELLLATRANVVIIDPNADYCHFYSTIDDAEWRPATYCAETRTGRLPTEMSTSSFKRFLRSPAMSMRILTNHVPRTSIPANVERVRLQVEWGQLDATSFYDIDARSETRAALTAAHEFALTAVTVQLWKDHGVGFEGRYVRTATDLAQVAQLVNLRRAALLQRLRHGADLDNARMASAITEVLDLARFVSRKTWLEYERTLTHMRFEDVLTDEFTFDPSIEEPARLQVLDTSSAPASYRGRIVEVLLGEVVQRAKKRWAAALAAAPEADERPPTFIVVEEAQHVAPAQSGEDRQSGLSRLVREIAAEGRKYGLFLVVVTQRPEKVDPLVLSEIENIAIMRLNTPDSLERTRQILGLEHESDRLMQEVLRFPMGRALLLGRWVNYSPQLMYAAMRRTAEGGRNLRPQAWAHPPVW